MYLDFVSQQKDDSRGFRCANIKRFHLPQEISPDKAAQSKTHLLSTEGTMLMRSSQGNNGNRS